MTNNLWTLVRYIYCIAFLVVFVIFMEAAFHKETIGKQIEGVFLAFIFGIVPMAAMYFVTKEAVALDTIPKIGDANEEQIRQYILSQKEKHI